jgi:hypothetical protein
MKKAKVLWFRWLFRKHGESGWNYSGHQRFAQSSLSEAQQLIDKWNREDKEKREYRVEEILPGDFDYPKER